MQASAYQFREYVVRLTVARRGIKDIATLRTLANSEAAIFGIPTQTIQLAQQIPLAKEYRERNSDSPWTRGRYAPLALTGRKRCSFQRTLTVPGHTFVSGQDGADTGSRELASMMVMAGDNRRQESIAENSESQDLPPISPPSLEKDKFFLSLFSATDPGQDPMTPQLGLRAALMAL